MDKIYISENKEQNRGTSRKANSKWSTREAIDVLDGGFYYKVIIGGREEYNFSSLW